jgi:hypothetical protein
MQRNGLILPAPYMGEFAMIQASTNLTATAVVSARSNERTDGHSAVPPGFSSSSRPSDFPIVSPEFSSISEPVAQEDDESTW